MIARRNYLCLVNLHAKVDITKFYYNYNIFFKRVMMAPLDRYMSRETQKKLRNGYLHAVMYMFSKLCYKTCRNRFHISDYANSNSFIACLWHGNFLMMPYLYRKVRSNPNMVFVTSAHDDGDIIEKYFAKFGLEGIRGSRGIDKGGAKALIKAIRALREGKDLAITPDGPKGPYKSIANGILLMAMKSGVGICGCRVKPSRFWQMKTWDKFCIPKPFSRIDYYLGEPLFLTPDMDIEEAKDKLAQYMKKIDEL